MSGVYHCGLGYVTVSPCVTVCDNSKLALTNKFQYRWSLCAFVCECVCVCVSLEYQKRNRGHDSKGIYYDPKNRTTPIDPVYRVFLWRIIFLWMFTVFFHNCFSEKSETTKTLQLYSLDLSSLSRVSWTLLVTQQQPRTLNVTCYRSGMSKMYYFHLLRKCRVYKYTFKSRVSK